MPSSVDSLSLVNLKFGGKKPTSQTNRFGWKWYKIEMTEWFAIHTNLAFGTITLVVEIPALIKYPQVGKSDPLIAHFYTLAFYM